MVLVKGVKFNSMLARHFHMVEKVLGGKEKVKVALAQVNPAFLNKDKCIEKARRLIMEAGRNGADLIVFPEAWIPTYPYWGGRFTYNVEKWRKVNITLQENSIVIPSEDTEKLCDAARGGNIHVVMGLNELDNRPGCRTLYNTLLFIGREGRILGRHRKLMPTSTERLFWGLGDASDLQVFKTDIGHLGGLICWEHHMVLVRAAMMFKGEEIHVAVWPGSWCFKGPRVLEPDITSTLCDLYPAVREYAFEAGCFVVSCSAYVTRDAIPNEFPDRDTVNVDWAVGGSAVVGPFGTYIVEPVYGKEALIYADCPAEQIKAAKVLFDQIGHYSRFDVVRLALREEPWTPTLPSKNEETLKSSGNLRTPHNARTP